MLSNLKFLLLILKFQIFLSFIDFSNSPKIPRYVGPPWKLSTPNLPQISPLWVPFSISPIQIEINKFNNNHMWGIWMDYVWDPTWCTQNNRLSKNRFQKMASFINLCKNVIFEQIMHECTTMNPKCIKTWFDTKWSSLISISP